MRSKWILLVITVLIVGLWSPVMAADQGNTCDGNKIIVATGVPTGTYSQVFKTIEKMIPDQVCEDRSSTGGFDNVNLLVGRKVDAAIVQADVMEFTRRTEPMVEKKLRGLVSLYGNVAHIIVAREGFSAKGGGLMGRLTGSKKVIHDLRDLRDQKVALFGSGFITGRIIDERLRLGLQFVEVDKKDEGLRMVKDGEVAAMIAMGGKPIDWVEKLDRNVYTLANVDNADISSLGRPYYGERITYRNLGVIGAYAIAVKNDLIVWDYTGVRARQIEHLKSFLKANLNDIKEARGSHPAWQGVDDLDAVSWTKYTGGGESYGMKGRR